MNRRLFFLLPSLVASSAQRRAPNIVLILADDLGSADLGCYGSKDLRTPAIDSLARDGLRFLNAYANAPECTPSRCALLTGRYPQRVGGLECAIGLGNVGRYDEAVWLQQRGELGLPQSETTLAAYLKMQGYDTALIGKWHLGYLDKHAPNRHGFDEAFYIQGGAADYFRHTEQDQPGTVLRHNGKPVQAKGYLTDVFAERAVDWLSRRSPDKPFFLYLPFNAPHNPFQTREDEGPPAAWTGADRPRYLRMIEQMDQRIGDVLRQIDKQGARNNTIVLFMSDNGAPAGGSNAPLRGSKSQVWEGGIRMPLLVRWPGTLPAGKTTSQVTLMFDATATVASAAGVMPYRGRLFDGVNLLPEWRGDAPVRPRTVFWRYKRANNRRKAVRDGDWKLISENGVEALYNLSTDPAEAQNRIEELPHQASRLRALLASWEQEVAAPRLKDFKP